MTSAITYLHAVEGPTQIIPPYYFFEDYKIHGPQLHHLIEQVFTNRFFHIAAVSVDSFFSDAGQEPVFRVR